MIIFQFAHLWRQASPYNAQNAGKGNIFVFGDDRDALIKNGI